MKKTVKVNNKMYECFLTELKRELTRLEDATPYRKETARLAYLVAKKKRRMNMFSNQRTSEKIVKSLLPYVNEERTKDVAKFLRVIFNDLITEQNMSDEFRKELQRRRDKRENKGIKLIKMLK